MEKIIIYVGMTSVSPNLSAAIIITLARVLKKEG